MNDVGEHYRRLLAPIYVWMVGGAEAALERNRELVRAADLAPRGSARALDLGAGFGATSIALAERGWNVTAVDTSDELLAEFARLAGALPIRRERADLVEFAERARERFELVVCLGDTLTHLPSRERVLASFDAFARLVAPDGRLVLSFRDYVTKPLEGAERFIPVRSDDRRVFTCFLEIQGEHVIVHDVLYERGDDGWKLSVSDYPKLRLAPDWVVAELVARGFELEQRAFERGMLTLQLRRR
jgi:2-polyprenyl-3-methyl-5-hydroxy-6-metoxy-1,4-benzoquinol methylase